MSIYGVLIGRVVEAIPQRDDPKSPHYEVKVETGEGEVYEVPINVRSSKDKDLPDLLYYADENYNAQAITILPRMEFGFHKIDYHNNINTDISVDFIRSGLFDPNKMTILPYTEPGEKK